MTSHHAMQTTVIHKEKRSPIRARIGKNGDGDHDPTGLIRAIFILIFGIRVLTGFFTRIRHYIGSKPACLELFGERL